MWDTAIGGKRGVECDEIRGLQEFVERYSFDLHRSGALVGEVGVVCDHIHAESTTAAGDPTADPTEADHADGFRSQFDALESAPFPLAAPETRDRLRYVSGQCQQESHRMLGGGDRVRSRCVHDDHTALHCRLQIDVVDAHTRPSDDLESVTGRDHISRRPNAAANDQAVVARDPLHQPRGAQPVDHIEVELGVRFEKSEGFDREVIGDQHSECHGISPLRPTT